jgi:chemotaxis protein CheX
VGDLEGQVVFSFPRETAIAIVSRMMGMPIEELDELGRSALAEFGNIVSGNALMLMTKALRNISVDITPPSVITGEELEVSVENVPTLVIPVEVEGFGSFEVNVALKPKK